LGVGGWGLRVRVRVRVFEFGGSNIGSKDWGLEVRVSGEVRIRTWFIAQS